MKNTLTIIVLFLACALPAQRLDSTEKRGIFGPVTTDFVRTTENGETRYSVSVSFQTELRELGLIILHDQKSLDSLISDLKGCQPYMKIGRKPSITYDRARYQVSVFEFSIELTLYDRGGRKTNLTKGQVKDLIEWLEGITFP